MWHIVGGGTTTTAWAWARAGGWVQVTNQAPSRARDTPIGLRRVEYVGVPTGWAWFGHYIDAGLGG